jgi:hypothetical protein
MMPDGFGSPIAGVTGVVIVGSGVAVSEGMVGAVSVAVGIGIGISVGCVSGVTGTVVWGVGGPGGDAGVVAMGVVVGGVVGVVVGVVGVVVGCGSVGGVVGVVVDIVGVGGVVVTGTVFEPVAEGSPVGATVADVSGESPEPVSSPPQAAARSKGMMDEAMTRRVCISNLLTTCIRTMTGIDHGTHPRSSVAPQGLKKHGLTVRRRKHFSRCASWERTELATLH